MTRNFEFLTVIRGNFKSIMDGLSIEQLNHIPTGFKNNIIWNIGHTLVTQQLLVYALSGNKMCFDDAFVDAFRKGSSATAVSEETINLIRKNLFITVGQMEKDYESGLFIKYKEYPTSFGVTLQTIEDAIRFNNIHEGVHLGYIMAMRKNLSS